MAKRKSIPVVVLQQLLRCNFETGQLFWKPRPVEMFSPTGKGQKAHSLIWNKQYAGKPAFTTPLSGRYLQGSIFGKGYLAHRVVWALHYGEWPKDIDHKDHNGLNNKISNLRSVTKAENQQNQARHKCNTSGVCGVYWVAEYNLWRAAIGNKGKAIHLGLFPLKNDAIAARKAAEIKYGFHPNHGG